MPPAMNWPAEPAGMKRDLSYLNTPPKSGEQGTARTLPKGTDDNR